MLIGYPVGGFAADPDRERIRVSQGTRERGGKAEGKQ